MRKDQIWSDATLYSAGQSKCFEKAVIHVKQIVNKITSSQSEKDWEFNFHCLKDQTFLAKTTEECV